MIPTIDILPKPPIDKKGWPWTKGTDIVIYDSKKNYPKISIVTPSYNQGRFLEETIRSVILQNYPNLEYIIIDGGSTDESVEIIKKYEKWITYWISEKDNGQSQAINKGLNKCSGEIFNWINSDDFYEPGSFYSIADNFLNTPHATCVTGKEKRIDSKGNFIAFSFGTTILPSLEDTLCASHIDQPSTFFKLSAVKKIGGVNEELFFSMDVDLWMRYLLQYGIDQIIKTNEIYINFRFHENSKTSTYIERAKKEYKMLFFELQRKLNHPYPEAIYADTLPLKNNLFNGIEIKNTINADYLFEKINSKYLKYTEDNSLIYRELSAYYQVMKLYPQSLYFLKKAIRITPLSWLNWKFTIHSLILILKNYSKTKIWNLKFL
ncbi:MAG: glycosyltransferase [Bacteroidota bacterium]|nr:glycosyltransferase [Bacteroidota bacterium]